MSDNKNPILNNPYEAPKRHYATRMNGKLDYEDIREGRRIFVPVNQSAIPSRAGKQKEVFDVNEEGLKYESHLINRLRNLIKEWRSAGYPYVTKVSRDLLNHWFIKYENEPLKNLFFAQREALETAIFLNEAAHKSNPGTNILEELSRNQKTVDPGKPCKSTSSYCI